MEACITKIRGLRPSSLYHSEHLHGLSPVNRARFTSCTVCPPQHLHSYFRHGDMADVFGQTRCHMSSRTHCSCACSLTGRKNSFGEQPQALLLAESADRGTQAVSETSTQRTVPNTRDAGSAQGHHPTVRGTSDTHPSWHPQGSTKPCLHEENTDSILPWILMRVDD